MNVFPIMIVAKTLNYENFSLTNPVLTLQLIVLSMCAGFVIAGGCALYNKRLIGNFVRKLVEREAMSPENAKTMGDIGYAKNYFVRNALKAGGVLRKVVHCVEEDGIEPVAPEAKSELQNKARRVIFGEPQAKYDTDYSSAHYYVPFELRDRALIRYEKKGTDPFTYIITILIVILIAWLALRYIPEILTMVDNSITVFRGSGSASATPKPLDTTAAKEAVTTAIDAVTTAIS